MCSKSKLYRYDADSGEWKERGIGQARLLQHKANHKIRMLMRQEKTLKIRANHIGENLPAEVFCGYTGVLWLHRCSVATLVFCGYTGVLRLHWCTVATLVFCGYTGVLRLHRCSAATLVFCGYTGVLWLHWCSAATLRM